MCRALGEATGSFVTISPTNVSLTCSPACNSQLGYIATVRVQAPFTLLTPIWLRPGRADDDPVVVTGGFDDDGARAGGDALALAEPDARSIRDTKPDTQPVADASRHAGPDAEPDRRADAEPDTSLLHLADGAIPIEPELGQEEARQLHGHGPVEQRGLVPDHHLVVELGRRRGGLVV